MYEIVNHFLDNLPSVVVIIIAMIIGWGIKEIFLKKNVLIDFEKKLKEDIKNEVDLVQHQINSLKNKINKHDTQITEVKVTLKYMYDILSEIKDYLYKNNAKNN